MDPLSVKTSLKKPSLSRVNVQRQFLNEKELETFSTICREIFDKHTPKKSFISNLAIRLSLIMKFLRQS